MLLKTFEYSIFHVLERRTSTVAGGDNEPSAASIFEQIRAGQQFVRKAETEEGCKQLDEEMKDEPGANPVLAEATEEVTEGKLMASCRQETRIPKVKRKTLAQIMEKHENLDAALSDLWKLLFFLRSGAEGCDVALVPHPFATRLATQKKEQRWHDKLLQQIKQMDEQLKQPAVRQSRQTSLDDTHRAAEEEARSSFASEPRDRQGRHHLWQDQSEVGALPGGISVEKLSGQIWECTAGCAFFAARQPQCCPCSACLGFVYTCFLFNVCCVKPNISVSKVSKKSFGTRICGGKMFDVSQDRCS